MKINRMVGEVMKSTVTEKFNLRGRRSFDLRAILGAWQLYMMLLIPVIYILIFAYVPMNGIQLAFRKYSAASGIYGGKWVGFDYFIRFFKDYQFSRVLINTLSISLYTLIAGFPLPIIFAMTLNATRSRMLKKTVQMVSYMPHFISTVVVVSIVMQVFNVRIGLYSKLADFMGMPIVDLFGKAGAFPHLYVWSGVWQNMGWGSIVYLAALSNVPMELHEAAMIDGASRFKRLLHIDFQAILPTACILLIMNSGQIMNIGFEKVFLMQNPLNLRTSELISTYVFKTGLTSGGGGDFSYATAIGLFNSVVNLILLVSVNQVVKKFGDTSLW